MSNKIELPETAERVAVWDDFSSYIMTLERDNDGIVYLVSWAYGVPYVLAKIRPGGSIEEAE